MDNTGEKMKRLENCLKLLISKRMFGMRKLTEQRSMIKNFQVWTHRTSDCKGLENADDEWINSPKTHFCDILDIRKSGNILKANAIGHSKRNEDPGDNEQIISSSLWQGKNKTINKQQVCKCWGGRCFWI